MINFSLTAFGKFLQKNLILTLMNSVISATRDFGRTAVFNIHGITAWIELMRPKGVGPEYDLLA